MGARGQKVSTSSIEAGTKRMVESNTNMYTTTSRLSLLSMSLAHLTSSRGLAHSEYSQRSIPTSREPVHETKLTILAAQLVHFTPGHQPVHSDCWLGTVSGYINPTLTVTPKRAMLVA